MLRLRQNFAVGAKLRSVMKLFDEEVVVMGLFGFFKKKFLKKKKVELTEEQIKFNMQWNKMWDLWVNEQAQSPYAELMTYQSEVNNGGHAQYFDNVSNTSDLQKEMQALETILPPQHRQTLKAAYEANLAIEQGGDEKAQKILERCDAEYYNNEPDINRILEGYAATIQPQSSVYKAKKEKD